MAPHKEVVLKLTSFRYKKPGVDEKEFWEFATKDHAPKAAAIQTRHGALKVSQYWTLPVSKKLITEKIPWAIRPGWEIDDSDIQVSVYVRDTETMQAIVMDPDFQALVADDDKYSRHDKARVTAGWEEVFVEDGKIVEQDLSTTFEQRTSIGQASKVVPAGNTDNIRV